MEKAQGQEELELKRDEFVEGRCVVRPEADHMKLL